MASPDVISVVSALARHKNVLLEGPPGTGKTRLITDVIQMISDTRPAPAGGRPQIRPGVGFGTAEGPAKYSPLPLQMTVEWVTFHQSFTYEEFILGRRPVPVGSGLRLEPHFGTLTSLAIELGSYDANKGVLLVIDEINRANASQVFGEFITLLDPDYRATVGGIPNPRRVHPRFPGIEYESKLSEPIKMLRGGGTRQLPKEWAFPENVYVLATMNSVDKAALPLDSALTRRFHRLHCPPDLRALAAALGMDWANVETAATRARVENDWQTLSAEQTAVLLLERLNVAIATDLSEDFELGHGLAWPVAIADPNARWEALVRCWDHSILPQIVERFAGRNEALRELLKLDTGLQVGSAFSVRTILGRAVANMGPLHLPDLAGLPLDIAKTTLRWLAT
ncbi:MAG: AAA family ATPase [Pseudomonadota bacterium]